MSQQMNAADGVQVVAGFGMNATEVCPSRARLLTHWAHGQICPVCEPCEPRPARCPLCMQTVTAAGFTVQPHQIEDSIDCPGSGVVVEPPPLAERPPWQPGQQRRGVARVRRSGPVLAPAGGDAA